MPYSSYDHDKLEAAETMRIERRIYFEAKDREIAPYASLPIAQLLSMRSESAAAEQAIFDDLKERAAAWEEQAGRTLLLDKTLEYVRTPHVQHTANEWQTTEHNRHIRSNRVYQMNYYIYENTRYDKEAQKSIPYSWTLTWSVRTNSPSRTQAKIATVYKGNIIKNLIMDCQSYTKYRPNETTGGIFVSWRRKEELPTGA